MHYHYSFPLSKTDDKGPKLTSKVFESLLRHSGRLQLHLYHLELAGQGQVFQVAQALTDILSTDTVIVVALLWRSCKYTKLKVCQQTLLQNCHIIILNLSPRHAISFTDILS